MQTAKFVYNLELISCFFFIFSHLQNIRGLSENKIAGCFRYLLYVFTFMVFFLCLLYFMPFRAFGALFAGNMRQWSNEAMKRNKEK